MGNYHRLTRIENPHVVSNYWKKMMREMSHPICPFDHYPKFMELTPIPAEQRLDPLKDRIHNLPKQNYNTLKFIIKFMRTVVEQSEHNKMNFYNIAVTVGPNIFRSQHITAADLFNAGTYYDIMIKMMQHFEYIFGSEETTTDSLLEQALEMDKMMDDNSRISAAHKSVNLNRVNFNAENFDMAFGQAPENLDEEAKFAQDQQIVNMILTSSSEVGSLAPPSDNNNR